jgi:adenosylmethionine-8-amino-7-oxononanoate aminotransferase
MAMSKRIRSNQEIWEKDRRHHVHPFHNFVSYDENGSLIMNKGEGAYLHDIEGKEYFDAVGGMWCTNIGLGRQEMADAIAEQVVKLAYANPFTDMSNEPAALLAAKLAELAPGDLNHVLFTGGGSTANDTAFRMIQMYQAARGKKSKKHVLVRLDAYHGTTYLTTSLSGTAGESSPEFNFVEGISHHLSCPSS